MTITVVGRGHRAGLILQVRGFIIYGLSTALTCRHLSFGRDCKKVSKRTRPSSSRDVLIDMKFFWRKAPIETERQVQANKNVFNGSFHYKENYIKTSKYNIITFLPMNLFEQFQRVANIYFLLLLILQLVPIISSLDWFTTVVPLVGVIAISAIKDGSDDYIRHKSDHQVNSRRTQVLTNGELRQHVWMDIKVGDIIKLENNQPIPADLLLLSSSESLGLCYLETAERDGETNLKARQALETTADFGDDVVKLSTFTGMVICEPPNNRLDRFNGRLVLEQAEISLNSDNILLRGCMLRNTDWCFGLTIYAGSDSKLMQNSGKSHFKRTTIDHLMNRLVLCIFLFLLTMSTILAIGHTIWLVELGEKFHVFLPAEPSVNNAVFDGFLMFWSYIIILNTVVPISLYVSVEIIRLGQSFFICWDVGMWNQESGIARARSTNLSEELGQIACILTDKTGTLTRNVMRFIACSVHGKLYGNLDNDDGSEDTVEGDKYAPKMDAALLLAAKSWNEHVTEFFRALALCHTVVAEQDEKGNVVYQAQSPDEAALVNAARAATFRFESRARELIELNEPAPIGRRILQVVALLDFTNERRRMGVVVQTPEGKLVLYCKGADSAILPRLKAGSDHLADITTEHMHIFAGSGLRTLCVAMRILDETEFTQWSTRLHQASTAIVDREEKVAAIYEELETDLTLLGASAIEDRLQEGVPETILSLLSANLRVWVLTGDKQETAVNIGYSCNLLSDSTTELFILCGSTIEEVSQELRTFQAKIDLVCRNWKLSLLMESQPAPYALVINGPTLALALEPATQMEFLRVAFSCQAVVCCRATPLQKAQIVELVKKEGRVVTLAIGDGANDVGMIKAAHIGVGITGREGTQAALASDFSFGQFQFLQRLLFVHGRLSYQRTAKFLSYFFYKNFAFTLVHFWFAFFNGFSAQTVYDEWFITLYNLVFTSLPVLALAIFDQDMGASWSLAFPSLYEPGRKSELFNSNIFMGGCFRAAIASLALFFIPFGAYSGAADYQTFALVAGTSTLLVVGLQMAMDIMYWTAVNQFFLWGSTAVYFAAIFTMSCDGMHLVFPSEFPFVGVPRNALRRPDFWFTVLLSVTISLLPTLIYRFIKIDLTPTLSQKVACMAKLNRTAPAPSKKPKKRPALSQRSAYAFSHSPGFGTLVMRGVNKVAKRKPQYQFGPNLVNFQYMSNIS